MPAELASWSAVVTIPRTATRGWKGTALTTEPGYGLAARAASSPTPGDAAGTALIPPLTRVDAASTRYGAVVAGLMSCAGHADEAGCNSAGTDGHGAGLAWGSRTPHPCGRAMPAPRRRVLPRWMHATRTIRVGGVIRQWPPPPLMAPRPPRPVSRTWWAWTVLGSLIVLLASITFVASSESAPVPAHVTGTGGSTHPGATGEASPGDRQGSRTSGGSGSSGGSGDASAQDIPLGVYAGEANPFGVATFGLQTGTLPSFATDYLDKSDGWAGLDAAANIKAWSPTHYHLVIGVPILPGVGTLAQGATGAYDQYFSALGQTLVSDHEADAILRLGVGVQRDLVHVVRRHLGRRRQLRGLLAPDRHHHARRARCPLHVPVEPQRPEPHDL